MPKGGPYNKWFGNNWSVVNWENNGNEIRNIKDEKGKVRSRTQNEKIYFKEGVTSYTASGSKGASFRLHQETLCLMLVVLFSQPKIIRI